MRTDLTEEQRKELINALQAERDRFNANFMDISDHVETLTYLSTGGIRGDENKNDMLYSAIHDTIDLYQAYCS